MKRIVFAALALAGAMAASPAAAQGGCDRELLQGIAGDWISALEKGSGFEMKLGEWVEFQNNLELGSMGAFLDKPRKVDWHQALLDTGACKVMVESVILDEAQPLVLSTVLTNGFFGVSPHLYKLKYDASSMRPPRSRTSAPKRGPRSPKADATAVRSSSPSRTHTSTVSAIPGCKWPGPNPAPASTAAPSSRAAKRACPATSSPPSASRSWTKSSAP